MKKATTILDFFKAENVATCPACRTSMPKSKLNEHLDSFCSSSYSKSTSTVNNITDVCPLKYTSNVKSKFQRTILKKKLSSRNRLSLKKQKEIFESKGASTVNLKVIKDTNCATCDEDEITILDEIITKPTTNEVVSTLSIKSNDKHLVEKQCQLLHEGKNLIGNKHSEGSDQTSHFEACNLISDSVHSLLHNKNNEDISVSESVKNDLSMSKCKVSETKPDTREVICSNLIDQTSCGISSSTAFSQSGQNPISDDSDKFNNLIPPVSSQEANVEESLQDSNMKLILLSSKSCTESKQIMSPNIASDVAALIQDAEESLDVDDNVFSENSSQKENVKNDRAQYSPYYIANFKHILKSVLSQEENKHLFNDEDLNFITAFESSTDAAQKFYVRLFQRKYKWLRLNKINYPDIAKDPVSSLEELVNVGLLDAGADKVDLSTALELLSLPESKNLMKHFKLNSGKGKSENIQMLLKHCKEHKSVFFSSCSNISNTMLKKAKQMIGHCYRISLLPKRAFTRILMLFSLPTMSEDDDEAAGGQQQQLLTLLQVNKGELVFPNCKGIRKTVIFEDRDDLIRYEEAKQLENDILKAVENKKFLLAKDLFNDAKDEFEQQCSCSFTDRASLKPVFLKRYTSLHVYIRCLTQGVEILQKLRQYDEAVELLKNLLSQKMFCQDYRGRWSDRMALNLEQHLKKPYEALEAIKEALKDENVRVGHRYSLLIRALRIIKSVDVDEDFKKQVLEDATIIEAPKVTMRGRLFPRNILGRRNVFISSASTAEEDDITVLGVEQLALEHYKNEGFTEGIHGEGSTFISLYALLFWDIIYDGNIPDAFISPYQTHPLDLNYESFFCSRKDQVLNHLKTIQNATVEELREIVKSTWEAHFNQSSLVAWDRFTDLECVQGLVSCLGNSILSGICERLAKDFRFTRSGVPDLVVWNPETLLVKIVEVKGPGDKLSSKQILWLDYLIKLGAEAEVCLIEAVGSKRLRKE